MWLASLRYQNTVEIPLYSSDGISIFARDRAFTAGAGTPATGSNVGIILDVEFFEDSPASIPLL
jgi:hypothetical protein